MSSRVGLRVVALFEAAKGLVVLVAGLGLLELMHQDVQAAAERLVRHLHLNPASHYPRIFIEASVWLDDAHLRWLAAGALAYAAVRLVEACGLWRERRWAEWFGTISGSVYLPVEVYEMWERVTWPRTTVLVVNSIIVIYLVQALMQDRVRPPPPAASPSANPAS
jgi:uncharacterized membrane protein (DUF2068 family)